MATALASPSSRDASRQRLLTIHDVKMMCKNRAFDRKREIFPTFSAENKYVVMIRNRILKILLETTAMR
jgi:hypothetical protein